MASKILNNLRDLFRYELQDIYNAENQLIEALQKVSEEVNHDELKRTFRNHLDETRNQIERLEKISKDLDINLKGETCEAMEGMIKETRELLNMDINPDVKDAGLIAAAQRIEHYEIAVYGTLVTFAKRLGHNDAERLLNETLNEEKNADRKLNEIALQTVNQEAEVAE